MLCTCTYRLVFVVGAGIGPALNRLHLCRKLGKLRLCLLGGHLLALLGSLLLLLGSAFGPGTGQISRLGDSRPALLFLVRLRIRWDLKTVLMSDWAALLGDLRLLLLAKLTLAPGIGLS